MVSTAQLLSGWLKKKNAFLSEVIFWMVYGALCLVLVVQILVGNSFLSPYLTILYVPFYILGYVFGNYGKRFLCWGNKEIGKLDCKNSRLVQVLVAGMAVLFLYLVAARNLNSMETKVDSLIQIFASVIGCGAIIYGVLWWKDGKIKALFEKIGLYTLELYVIHYHFANLLNFNDKQYDFYTVEGAVFVVISFVSMCAITFCCIWVMKKVKILSFLFFGKPKEF